MPNNLLVILSDEHNPQAMGCAGHPEVLTPNLDRLARRGTRFAKAVCASPICVPARASLATGLPVFLHGCWDNVLAYDGRVPSWHHVLRSRGHEVVSIGKLHYRGWSGDDYGFSESILPMYLHEGRGEVKMLLRDPPADLGDGSSMLASAGPGESSYTRYDEEVCRRAERWLADRAARPAGERPWVLFVSLVAPHFPLTAPERFHALYAGRELAMPKAYVYGRDEHAHPYVKEYAAVTKYNDHFRDERDVRRALAGYYGLVSSTDDKVGRLMDVLDNSPLRDDTVVMYLSDHGDHAGSRGLWGKGTMYAESVGIPWIIAGPGFAAGRVIDTPVQQVDLFPTVLDVVGIDPEANAVYSPAASLRRALDTERLALSEYHAVGSRAAGFMLQGRGWKYVHYVDAPAQLFDLANDPAEMHDLAPLPEHAGRLAHWREQLLKFCEPRTVDGQAKRRQAEMVAFHGGEAAIRSRASVGGYTPAPRLSTQATS